MFRSPGDMAHCLMRAVESSCPELVCTFTLDDWRRLVPLDPNTLLIDLGTAEGMEANSSTVNSAIQSYGLICFWGTPRWHGDDARLPVRFFSEHVIIAGRLGAHKAYSDEDFGAGTKPFAIRPGHHQTHRYNPTLCIWLPAKEDTPSRLMFSTSSGGSCRCTEHPQVPGNGALNVAVYELYLQHLAQKLFAAR